MDSWFEMARRIFPGARSLTATEKKRYSAVIRIRSIPVEEIYSINADDIGVVCGGVIDQTNDGPRTIKMEK